MPSTERETWHYQAAKKLDQITNYCFKKPSRKTSTKMKIKNYKTKNLQNELGRASEVNTKQGYA